MTKYLYLRLLPAVAVLALAATGCTQGVEATEAGNSPAAGDEVPADEVPADEVPVDEVDEVDDASGENEPLTVDTAADRGGDGSEGDGSEGDDANRSGTGSGSASGSDSDSGGDGESVPGSTDESGGESGDGSVPGSGSDTGGDDTAGSTAGGDDTAGSTAGGDGLDAVDWVFAGGHGADGAIADPRTIDPGSPVTLTIADGRYGGKAVCNQYSGSAEIGDSSLALGLARSTRMSCGEDLDPIAAAYLNAMSTVTGFQISSDGQRLTLTGAGVELHFDRAG